MAVVKKKKSTPKALPGVRIFPRKKKPFYCISFAFQIFKE